MVSTSQDQCHLTNSAPQLGMVSPNREQCLLARSKAQPKFLLLPCPTEGLQGEVLEGWD